MPSVDVQLWVDESELAELELSAFLNRLFLGDSGSKIGDVSLVLSMRLLFNEIAEITFFLGVSASIFLVADF